jgi:L,D-peptidoglycan transpeptidase YkuD (ErfK/YbiS/YcfS/YnhG family)
MVAMLATAALCFHATGHAQQLVTVEVATARSTTAVVRLWERDGSCWRSFKGPWPARVGRTGVSSHHVEGDGTTPLGTFGIGPVVYGIAADPGTKLAYHRIACGDWWDEDPASRAYNLFVHIRCGATPPFNADSEALWKPARAYVHFAVIEYNTSPIVPGRGSAIFIHADTGTPTNGCVSLPRVDLVALLRWLQPDAAPAVSIRLRAS